MFKAEQKVKTGCYAKNRKPSLVTGGMMTRASPASVIYVKLLKYLHLCTKIAYAINTTYGKYKYMFINRPSV